MKESEYLMRLAYLQGKLRAIYDPKTAFLNPDVIAIARQIEQLVEQREGEGGDCWKCDGRGYVEHDCNCEHCDVEDDCPECEGRGFIGEEKPSYATAK